MQGVDRKRSRSDGVTTSSGGAAISGAATNYYEPHSLETAAAHGLLLAELRGLLPPGCENMLADVCEEALAAAFSPDAAPAAKHRALEAALGSRLGDGPARTILQLATSLTDYVGNDAAAAAGASDGEGLLELEENGDEDGEGAEGATDDTGGRKKRARREAGGGAANAEWSDWSDDDRGGSTLLGRVGGGGDDTSSVVDIEAVDEASVAAEVHAVCPSKAPGECQELVRRLVGCLGNRSLSTAIVETQLGMFLGSDGDSAAFISRLAQNRWRYVYGMQLAAISAMAEKNAASDARARLVTTVEVHGRLDDSVAAVYHALTGKQLRSTAAREGGADGVLDQPLECLDLAGMLFVEDDPATLLGAAAGKPRVPQGTQRIVYPTHEEIILPAVVRHGDDARLQTIADALPAWAQSAFPGQTTFNAMQSKVWETAFKTDANMLVCAPTGAGKTNVAMLTLLRALSENCRINEATGMPVVDNFKAVYVAPMKALVQEVVRTFRARLATLGLVVAELSGDSGLSKEELLETNLIVTTPEKWDIVTRKAIDTGIATLVRLIVIDEVHLLHNERGPVLEAIVARTLGQASSAPVRLVGLSATLPNHQDVGKFLRVDPAEGLFHFGPTYRPIPLQQTFCALRRRGRGAGRVAALNDVAYAKVMEHAGKAQVLVFVHSRKDTRHTATFMKEKLLSEQRTEALLRTESESKRILMTHAEDPSNRNPDLRALLGFGFAVHHAGMSQTDRALVERLFLEGHIQVLVATSTLAWGVNLPAHAVIIKGTQIFAPDKGGWTKLSALDVFQMFGRAGRPGFGSSFGEAVIITTSEELEYYLSLLNQQLPIESQMLRRLVDHVNAEIVLGAIADIADGIRWLETSYLYVRMRRNGALYDVSPDELRRDPLLLRRRANLVHTAFVALHSHGLAVYDVRRRTVKPTDLGRIASHFYIGARSVAVYKQMLKPQMEDADLFRLFASSDEFSKVTVRADEREELRRLLSEVPVAIKEQFDAPLAKINALLQCYISQRALPGHALASELVYVKDSATRIVKALHEMACVNRWAAVARKLQDLYAMVMRRQWTVQTPLRQFADYLPGRLIASVEDRKLGWESFYFMEVEDFAGVAQGNRTDMELLHAYKSRVPRFDVTAIAQPLSHGSMRIEVEAVADFEYVSELHGRVVSLQITCEDADGSLLLHREVVELAADALREQRPVSLAFVVPIAVPKPTHCFVRASVPGWIGSDTSAAVNLMPMVQPDAVPLLLRVGGSNGAASPPRVAVSDVVPTPAHVGVFPFDFLNPMQSVAHGAVCRDSRTNVFIAMPGGCGRTTLAELFIMWALHVGSSAAKVIYVVPNDARAARRFAEWSVTLGPIIAADGGSGAPVALIVGDGDSDVIAASGSARVIVATVTALTMLMRRFRALTTKLFNNVVGFVFDDLHRLGDGEAGPAYESLIASVMGIEGATLDASQRSVSPPRILGLSLPVYSTKELIQWLRVPADSAFNFDISNREVQVSVETCDAPGYRNRFAFVSNVIAKRLNTKATVSKTAVVFVPTASDALACAKIMFEQFRADSVGLGAADANHMTSAAALGEDLDCDDQDLAMYLTGGVAFYHGALSVNDRQQLLGRVMAQTPTVVYAPFSAAWELPGSLFDFAYVCVAERAPPPAGGDAAGAVPHSDCVVAEVLQMASRAALEATVFARAPRREYWRKFLCEPYPLESMAFFAGTEDALNAAVAGGHVQDMAQVVGRHFVSLYATKRTSANPNFYSVPTRDVEDRRAHLSGLADEARDALVAAGCVSYDAATQRLRPTLVGLAAGRHCLPVAALSALTSLLDGSTSPVSDATLLFAMCAVPGVAGVAVRSRGEARRVRDVLATLPTSRRPVVADPDAEWVDPASGLPTRAAKAYALVCCHLGRRLDTLREVAPDLLADTCLLVPALLRALRSAAEVVCHWSPALSLQLMRLCPAVVQAVWPGDSPLLQLPLLTADACVALAAVGVRTTVDLANLDDEQRVGLLPPAPEDVAAIAAVCNDVPVLADGVQCEQQVDLAGGRCVVRVLIQQEGDAGDGGEGGGDSADAGAPLPDVHCPYFSMLRSFALAGASVPLRHGWWIAVTDARSGALCAVRHVVATSRSELVELAFPLRSLGGGAVDNEMEGDTGGAELEAPALQLRLLCDSYVVEYAVDAVPLTAGDEGEAEE